MGDLKYEVPDPTTGDHVHALVRAGISLIPVVSGPATELFSLIVAPPLEGRRNEWMNAVAEGLQQLEEKIRDFTIEGLVGNERFVSGVLTATQAALRTHQREKREALRNAVLNIAIGSKLDEAVENVFINVVDRYTYWHLRILKLFQNPQCNPTAMGLARAVSIGGSRAQLLETCHPELKGQRQFYDVLVKDLHSDGMLGVPELQVMVTASGMLDKLTTEWGDRFLKFISTPLEP